ncbi:glycosyl hydrolase family 28-related protein [Limibacterium fermenti]|uniref:glycosyl hydrolase family 28-related protein n=1 Tax=Limibacterium fermenti TaxID=3229863 RepID=UPI003A606C15
MNQILFIVFFSFITCEFMFSQHLNSIITLSDKSTGEVTNYKQTNKWLDSTKMKDSKVDGIIYIKQKGLYYRRIFNDRINIKWFTAKGDGIFDDANAFISALKIIKAFGGGVLYIPKGNYKITRPLYVDFDNLIIQGDGSKNSVLHINHNGIGLSYKSKIPDLSTARFNIYGISLLNKVNKSNLPSDKMQGIGIHCQEMHSSDWRDVYIENFLDGLILEESFLNIFTNYFSQSNWRGIKTIGGTNGNTFYNGVQRNSSIDLRGKGSEKNTFINIDIEPASNTQFVGNNNTFQNCRFERFNLLHGDFKKVWFVLGSNNKFIKCDWHWNWVDQPQEYMMQVYGSGNEIEISQTNTTPKLIFFKPQSKNNFLKYTGSFSDLEITGSVRYSANFIKDLGVANRILFHTDVGDIEYIGSLYYSAKGNFSNILEKKWYEGADINAKTLILSNSDIGSPLNLSPLHTKKIKVINDRFVRRIKLQNKISADGIKKYSASAWVFIPQEFIGHYVSISIVEGQYILLNIDDDCKGKWVRINGYALPDKNKIVQFCIDTDAKKNSFFYFSIPVLSEGLGAVPINYD